MIANDSASAQANYSVLSALRATLCRKRISNALETTATQESCSVATMRWTIYMACLRVVENGIQTMWKSTDVRYIPWLRTCICIEEAIE